MIEYAEALKRGTVEFFSEMIRDIAKDYNSYRAVVWFHIGKVIEISSPDQGKGTIDDIECLCYQMRVVVGPADEIVATYNDKESETIWVFWMTEESVKAKKFKAWKMVGRNLLVGQLEDAETGHLERFKQFLV